MTREEAINEIKSWAIPSKKGREVLETLIPELRESEDEKIRTLLVCLVQWAKTFKQSGLDSDTANKMLSYLEKQKEQQPAEWSEEDERIRKIIRLALIASEDELTNFYKVHNTCRKECTDWLKKHKEQKPVEWSMEDKMRLDSIISDYRELLQDYKACHGVDYIPDTSDTFIRNVVDDVDFLKSLRPFWKPSKEQMGALNYAYCELFKREDVSHNILGPLQNLIDTLSKL